MWVPVLDSQHTVCSEGVYICWKSIPSEAKFDCIFNCNYSLHYQIKIRRHIIDFQLSLISMVSGLSSLCSLFCSCDNAFPCWSDSWNYVNYEPNAISSLYCFLKWSLFKWKCNCFIQLQCKNVCLHIAIKPLYYMPLIQYPSVSSD